MSQENEQTELLREIVKWVRFAGLKEVKSTLETTLVDDQQRKAYQASDGSKGTREVASIAGYGSKSTVERLWKTWRKLGLGESFQVKGGGERFKRSFDLEDFDIEFSKITSQVDQVEQTETTAPTPAPTSAPPQQNLEATVVESS
jgi:hypothetical protein